MKFILTSTLLLLLLTSCREDDFDILPPITQEGLNTFGCIIDGEVMIPKDGRGGIGGVGANGISPYFSLDSVFNSINEFIRPPYFAFSASNWRDGYGPLIYIYLPEKPRIGSYIIDESNSSGSGAFSSHVHVLANVYSANPENPRYLSYYNSGTISIDRFDTLNTIISGTFSIKLVDAATKTDTIEVKDGRFDINWVTLNCGKPRKPDCPE